MVDCSSASPRSGRQFAQVPRVLVHALIRVDRPWRRHWRARRRAAAAASAPADPGTRASRNFSFSVSTEPALRHVEHGQPSGEDEEDAQLHQKIVQVAARQRVVEGLVPEVETDLQVSGRANDHESRNQQRKHLLADAAGKGGARQPRELGYQPGIGVTRVLVSLGRTFHRLV